MNNQIRKKIIVVVIFLFISFVFLYSFYRSKAYTTEANIKIKLQGDYSQNKNLILYSNINIYSQKKQNILHKQPITQIDNNIFNLKISLTGYNKNEPISVFIKPNKYFGRFFPNLRFVEGKNNFDFTEEVFFAGDINPIDGKISASDLSLIISQLGKVSDFNEITNLNNDNYTNTQDYMMALFSLEKSVTDEKIVIPTPNPTPTVVLNTTSIINKPSITTMIISSPTSTPISTPTQTLIPTNSSAITITPTPTISNLCSNMENGLVNSKIFFSEGTNEIPKTTKEICSFYKTTKYHSLPYRNPNCPVTENGIKKAYDRMKTYYPTYFDNTKLLSDWQTVVKYAKKYNFNPLFVIALWIEESAAGGASAQQLGCVYRRNKDDTFSFLSPSSSICEQMECLFGRGSVDPKNYALWACQYRYGYKKWQDNRCLEPVFFVRGVEFWYNYIGGDNLPQDCQIKYFDYSDYRCR